MIALDLDGTSVRRDGTLSARLGEAVREARRQGIRIILATGRMVQSARPYWEALDLGQAPLIAYNGAVIASMPAGTAIKTRHLPPQASYELARDALSAGFLTQIYVGDELWVSREDDRVRRYVEANHIPAWVRGGDEILAWPSPPIKILLQGEPDDLDRFRREIDAKAKAAGVRVFKSQGDYLEMVTENVGKGPALAEVAEILGVPRHAVMAVGDAENDLDMVNWAGFGVAMGQAPPEVKAGASWVTADLDHDGAALAIEKVLRARLADKPEDVRPGAAYE